MQNDSIFLLCFVNGKYLRDLKKKSHYDNKNNEKVNDNRKNIIVRKLKNKKWKKSEKWGKFLFIS